MNTSVDDNSSKAKNKRTRKKITAIILIISAFVLGFGISAVLFLKNSSPALSKNPPDSNSPSANSGSTAQSGEQNNTKPTVEEKLVPYEGIVEHIFFHPLIAYPERAFNGDSQSKGMDDWFVTVSEFKAVLDQLYSNGYVLVRLEDLYEQKTVNNSTVTVRRPLLIPENKKPLVLSVDDNNYYEYMHQKGTIYRLILDGDGKLASYSINLKGKPEIGYDNDIVPILETFIAKHPDFSFRGARGILALTGYEGVLGYRTDEDYPQHVKEIEDVKPVIAALKKAGWTFASHSYGHRNHAEYGMGYIQWDSDKWERQVQSLVGPTSVYIYPFGATLDFQDPKFKKLEEKGFYIFCGVQLENAERFGSHSVQTTRKNVDGISLRNRRKNFLHLFDTEKVIDLKARDRMLHK